MHTFHAKPLHPTLEQRVRFAAHACALLFLLILLSLAAPALVATAHTGHSVRPLHGPGYEHLDCSACLTVSRALFVRLNATLSESPSTYLASHRLNRVNQLKRRPYRNSELLVTEVMDNFCSSYKNDERTLRLHPKSKVRLYHQQIWKDVTLGVRHSLREDEVYPEGAHDPQWDDYVELRRYQVAKVYSPKDQGALHGMEMLAATPTMCATLVEDFEDEIEELVKLAHNLSDIEYGLCGLPLADPTDAAASGEAEAVRDAIRPITNICALTEQLREAAHQDQLRWSQYMRREERRKERLEEKEKVLKRDAEEPAEKTEVETQEGSSSSGNTGEHNGDKGPAKSEDVVNEGTARSDAAPEAAAEEAGSAAEDTTPHGDVEEGDL
ncbi:hypothetical protein ABB37_01257 [Leptomonas pyrrhocoris]|uniref:DUF3456 domain-containing protein n=1 Tax=Leptomonas pyrrhocoris TaxID=157538 RepID=A0A0N0DZ25_LEPPY|nr:hypothetical protein ABB37_01257 [Leptomonas pyrrhocoris]XP_015663211.1 hypothetical protein ABB37_01257 [Leptomonas pyrrhocoris]KPA84771.1 hypothetical protein ABB37_01257 [Leptomonas pyrrhocoris]KPA84772.1 hypothetical protein ABB37_01257 [Leptomonas pyrrhocoris]|eukprot:XP_015663210.1 hypothetical protein ABB37_01257 [Leptomonas pyrrhocoris]